MKIKAGNWRMLSIQEKLFILEAVSFFQSRTKKRH